MGGTQATNGTFQNNGSQLASQIAGYGGYQQQPIAPISQPQYPTGPAQSPQAAAAATAAQIRARSPMMAPNGAPRQQQPQTMQDYNLTGRGGNSR